MERTEKDEVMHLLKIIQIRTEEILNEGMKQYDLTAAQLDVLSFILKHEGSNINSTMLCSQMGLSKATISVLLKKLRQKKYLQFELNPSDDRQKQIIVSEKTKQIERELKSEFFKLEDAIFEGISAETVALMKKGMRRMYMNLQKRQERRYKDDKDNFSSSEGL